MWKSTSPDTSKEEEVGFDEEIKGIGDSDQILASIKSMSDMALEMFKHLQEGAMTREEAFKMTQTWMAAMLGNMKKL